MNPYNDKYHAMGADALTHGIAMKNSWCAHYPQTDQIKLTMTDMDHFPYRRFFRGVYNESEPVIFGRQAGYRPYKNFGCGIQCANRIGASYN